MHKQFHPTLYWECYYISLLESRLIHDNKGGTWSWYISSVSIRFLVVTELMPFIVAISPCLSHNRYIMVRIRIVTRVISQTLYINAQSELNMVDTIVRNNKKLLAMRDMKKLQIFIVIWATLFNPLYRHSLPWHSNFNDMIIVIPVTIWDINGNIMIDYAVTKCNNCTDKWATSWSIFSCIWLTT